VAGGDLLEKRVDDASLRAANPDRLMHGEDPETRSLSQVVYWIGAYRELLQFKDQLLIDMEVNIEKLSEPAEQEIRELDVSMLEIQRRRYRARLAYWQNRQQELTAATASNERVS
jgi:hypothetical protein